MKEVSFLHKINRIAAQRKAHTNTNKSIRRSVLAVALALIFSAMPLLVNAVQAANCNNLGLFAFPVAPKQGDLVTVFVSVTNKTATAGSYVVDTKILDPSLVVVSRDLRVVAVAANATVNYQITFATGASTQAGNYTIVARSFEGESVNAASRANAYCSTALLYFTLGCNGNNCPVED